jgi:hypothetical protein
MEKEYVFDKETIRNCFLTLYVDADKPDDVISFEVSSYENQLTEYLHFQKQLIKNKTRLISFNGLDFDTQVSTFVISNYERLLHLSGERVAEEVYLFVQTLLDQKNTKGYAIYKKKDLLYNDCDIASINNYNNQQKFASLKWIQYNMDYPNIMDMDCQPGDHLTREQILDLRKYCLNDCLSTLELYKINKGEVEIRQELSKVFNLNLKNSSEPDMVKKIFLDLLSKDLGISKWDLKDKKTYRPKIHLKEAILPYIKFKTEGLQKMLGTFKNLVLDGENLKGTFKYDISYRGLPISFALGGIHGAKRGDYKSGDGMIIKSFDVKSFYPNLAIRNRWAPAHINNEIFCNRYEWFYNERLKYDKKNPLNYMYKIVLNSTYGLSNEKNSFLKDSFFTMQITCNGQLSLVMLLEDLCERIPMARPLMVNTDGGEVLIPQEYEELFDQICKEWEAQTLLELEYEDYQRLIVFDVNNYIGIFKGKEIPLEKAKSLLAEEQKPLLKVSGDKIYHFATKCKGRFEVDKALHKNKSYRINRIALYNYFVLGIPVEKTIKEGQNIYDYCAGVRAKGDWKFIKECYLGMDDEMVTFPLPKTIRYYACKNGCKILKVHKSKTVAGVLKLEASSSLEEVAINVDSTLPIEYYQIDYSFYIKKVNREINNLKALVSQTTLNL